jgi:formate dehydrogenase subunit gamma
MPFANHAGPTAAPKAAVGISAEGSAAHAAADERIPRYAVQQRIHHWLLAISFLGLLATGVAILVGAPADVLRNSALIHRAAAVVMTLAPVFYGITYPKGLLTLLKDSFTYDKDDVQWLLHAPAYFLGHAETMPPQGRINAGEKFHHALVIISLVAIAASGYVLWLGKGGNPALYLSAGVVHDVSMAVLTVMLIGHLYFTFVYDALRAMLDGTVSRQYARLEHAKWLDALDSPSQSPARGAKPGRSHR